MAKNKYEISQICIQQVYVRNSGMWLVYDCSGIQTVKIENSGIQTSICGNLVYMSYTRQIIHIKLYNYLFLLWCGAGSRFATWYYAMHQALRQNPALNATIHNQSFTRLSKMILWQLLSMI